MSAVDSTDSSVSTLSTVVRAAGERGELPGWACASRARREHMARVAAVLSEWAAALQLPTDERVRWAAAGWLHDALRDAPAETLRPQVPPELRDLPPLLLHGPAAAERLRDDADEAFLAAVRYHTVGHPALDTLGRALYLADFLEPGRDFEIEWRASLSARMPAELPEVLIEVLDARIRHLLDRRKPIRPETAAFWSALTWEP